MAYTTLRFHGDLRGFLPYAQRDRAFAREVANRTAIKDVVEAAGVPHTEVGALLVNGAAVAWGYRVSEGDAIEVFPVDEPAPTAPPATDAPLLQPAPPRPARFVLDVHLGRLAAYLRMLGFDTLYQTACDDDVLARRSSQEGRILLTRDVGLLKRGEVIHGHFVRATNPERQLAEIIRRYALAREIAPFHRCPRCNGPLAPVAKAEVLDRLPPRVAAIHDEFRACQSCGHLYWKGTHYARIMRLAKAISDDVANNARRCRK